MDALRKSVGGAAAVTKAEPTKKANKGAAGQKEMPMPIAGTNPAKQASSKKPAAPRQRKSA
jgi:DNA end-binding protein Ku